MIFDLNSSSCPISHDCSLFFSYMKLLSSLLMFRGLFNPLLSTMKLAISKILLFLELFMNLLLGR